MSLKSGFKVDCRSKIIVVNMPTDGLDLSIKDVQKVYKKKVVARQPLFDLERCLYNLDRLSKHFIQVFRYLCKDHGDFDFLNMYTDNRCAMMIFHLIFWELTAMISP